MKCHECNGVGHAANEQGRFAECFSCLGKGRAPEKDWEQYRVHQREKITMERVAHYFRTFLAGLMGYGIGYVLSRMVR